MAEQRHPRLWPLPLACRKSTKHQDNGSSLPSPQPALVSLALYPVHLACPPISSWGWAGSTPGLFQHLLGVGIQIHRQRQVLGRASTDQRHGK